MAWIKCSGGSTDLPCSAEMKYNNTTSGTSIFTVDTTGLYLLAVGVTYSGVASITLPQGVTAIYSKTVAPPQPRSMTAMLVNLTIGDEVTMTATQGGWTGFFKVAFLLSGITPIGEPTGEASSDTEYIHNAPTNSYALTFGAALAKSSQYTEQYIGRQVVLSTFEKYADGNCGANSVFRLSFDKGGMYRFYGYDGGMGAAISFPISIDLL